ncbi:uncharacterized protein LOC110265166 isoform X2 [Arachis ipaensis]|uniref:uncharacterized protein LOC110265166 isoform X2 n=1 Tax=Arachis ipaensis TaxID=130454 RepID=UPI000A2AF2DD|nr:uncharacterized protein LOC110265166 isoform X2 [Arachis ipaensis]
MCGLDHLIHEAGPLNFWVLHAATKMEEFSSTLMTPITHIGPVRVAIVLRILFCVQVCGQRRSFLLSVYTPGIRWMNWVSVIFRRLEGCLDRMPSFNHEERSVLVDLDGKGTFLVMLPGFAKERRQDPVLCVLVLSFPWHPLQQSHYIRGPKGRKKKMQPNLSSKHACFLQR